MKKYLKRQIKKIRTALIRSILKFLLKNKFEIQKILGELILPSVGKVGNDVRLHGHVDIRNPERLEIGDYVRIGNGCFFFCKGGLRIGKNTQISRNVTIYTANHDIKGNAIPYDDKYNYKPVVIGESVWIGMNVCITPGVSIGDGAIIGMGSTISKDVSAGEIVVSQKMRSIGNRDMEKFLQADNNELFFGKLWPNK